VGHIRWDEMGRAEELLTAGYEAGVESIPEIRNVIEEAQKAAPRWYQLRRRREAVALRASQSRLNTQLK
jgi:hypothetical protein